jgi:uncharacterized protein
MLCISSGLFRSFRQVLGPDLPDRSDNTTVPPQPINFIDSSNAAGYYSALMLRPSEFIDPWSAADKGMRFEGSVPVSELGRVVDLFSGEPGEVRFRLRFYRDARKRACVEGQVNASLRLTCQRCLQPMEIEVDSSISLALVEGLDEAERLPESYDPLLVTDQGVIPLDLVEDELLLALPQVPRHDQDEHCEGSSWLSEQASAPSADDDGPEAGTDNPFSALAHLKERLH